MTVCGFRFVLLQFLTVLALCVVPAASVPAQIDEAGETSHHGIELRSYSGSPLLLKLVLTDPERLFRHLEIETAGAALSYDLLGAHEGSAGDESTGGEVTIPVAPFIQPGVYDMSLRLKGPNSAEELRYQIGFTDFVWGRDNFRFGNNSNFETLHGDYSLALFAWLEERFAEVAEADRALLVHYMYGLFGQNPGRCYAFSGSQYRYIAWPELLPRFNNNVYEVRGSSRRIKREMHFLQMDIVFDYFVAGGMLRYGRQSLAAAQEEVEEVLRRISEGRPVVAGFVGPELHHSMLIYGFIEQLGSESIDLLVANNWKEDQESNVDNLNAELVRVNVGPVEERPLLEWFGRDGLRPRQPTRFFVVDVRRQYDHPRLLLDAHLTGVRRQMRSEGLKLLVVENVASAWLTDSQGNAAGYEGWRHVEEIPGITFYRRKRAHTFEIAGDQELLLHFEDENGARVYFVDLSGPATSWITETEAPAGEVERVIDLKTGDLVPEAPTLER